jgi:hypothetical protein
MGEQPEKTIKRRPKTKNDAADRNPEDFSIFLPPFKPAVHLTLVNKSEEVNKVNFVFCGQEGSILKPHFPFIKNPASGCDLP